MANRRIYLDNAATSFPKPPAVLRAMADYASRVGASPGRGHYAEAREGAGVLLACRERICGLIGGTSARHVVFTLNCSDALNLAIKGVVNHRRRTRPGRPIHVVGTRLDHNSVLRPLNALQAQGDIEWTCVDADPVTGRIEAGRIADAVRDDTALVVMLMASNVTGAIQPVGEIGRLCRERGALFLVDAAQALGHVPVDVEGMEIDLLAAPGHKGLLGPQGTGFLYIRPGVERAIDTSREGGTGSAHELDVQPESLPEKYEAGSHNTVGIAGLSEGAAHLLERGMDAVRREELGVIRVFCERLTAMEGLGLRLLGPREPEARVGVFSAWHERLSPSWIAAELEDRFGVLVRSGIHCAPRLHRMMGTLENPERPGAVRLSIGPSVTVDDAAYACDAIEAVVGGAQGGSEVNTAAGARPRGPSAAHSAGASRYR